ncbi:Uncharacterised protein [Vibrio cholerae]|nr:Uncharacterised protein [Vibrio cholerae]CSI54484.1 Uncharacterised protein [Vibrio cholerae]
MVEKPFFGFAPLCLLGVARQKWRNRGITVQTDQAIHLLRGLLK